MNERKQLNPKSLATSFDFGGYSGFLKQKILRIFGNTWSYKFWYIFMMGILMGDKVTEIENKLNKKKHKVMQFF